MTHTVTIDLSHFVIAVIFALALSWLVVALAVARPFISISRHKIWRARDRVYDARRKGLLPDDEMTEGLIGAAEWLIANIKRYTWTTSWLESLVGQRQRLQKAARYKAKLLRNKSVDQEKLIEDYCNDILMAIAIKTYLGSMSGLVVLAVGFLPVFLVSLLRHVLVHGIRHLADAFGKTGRFIFLRQYKARIDPEVECVVDGGRKRTNRHNLAHMV